MLINKREGMLEPGVARCCGECAVWDEQSVMHPGNGFCGHPKAPTTFVEFKVSVSCHYQAAKDGCLMAKVLQAQGKPWPAPESQAPGQLELLAA